MSRRKSVNIPGFQHRNPVPNASRIGNLMVSGVILGKDPATATMPEDLDGQLKNMFLHVEGILRAAGGDLGDLLKLTVWLRDPGDRDLLNQYWLERFTNPETRPARHVLPIPDGVGNYLVMCDIMAVIDDGNNENLGAIPL
jgi:2-iminobutanoate/2-iminopropanoate deaminase